MAKKIIAVLLIISNCIGLTVFSANDSNDIAQYIEAESALLDAHVQAVSNTNAGKDPQANSLSASASDSKYIYVMQESDGNSNNFDGSVVHNNPCMKFPIDIRSGKKYNVWARVVCANSGADSVFYSLDDNTYSTKYLTVETEWTWMLLDTPTLSVGAHSINLVYREYGFRIDRLLVTSKLDFIPEEKGELPVYYDYKYKDWDVNLNPYNNVHPRININASELELLKNDSRKSDLRSRLIGSANYRKDTHPSYFASNENSQREIGNWLSTFTVAYKISGNNDFLAAAKKYASYACDDLPVWGTDGKDLPAGHILYGLGMFYDWCYNDINDDSMKTKIRQTILERGTIMFEASLPNGTAFWRYEWLQNHMWVSVVGMMCAGLAIYDEEPEVKAWIDHGRSMMANTMQYLGSDGASHEGYGYWVYGCDWLIRYLDLAKKFMNTDYYQSVEWFENTAKYGYYMLAPQNFLTESQTNGINRIDFADDTRGGWGRSSFILRKLASEYNDGFAQYWADIIKQKDVDGYNNPWQELLYYNPDVVPVNGMNEESTLYHFDDMDIVSARSDWSGNESILGFKCGPYIGREALFANTTNPVVDWGGGHAHPDANHFVLFANGEYLIRDDGYASYKLSEQHNTLLVDGMGQLGETQVKNDNNQYLNATPIELADSNPKILTVKTTEDYHYMVGDAAEAYDSALGLTKFNRHMLYLKEGALIIFDDIATNKASALELRFFPETDMEQTFVNNKKYLLTGKKSKMHITNFGNNNLIKQSLTYPYRTVNDTKTTRDATYFSISTPSSSSWKNAISLTWSDKTSMPDDVQINTADNIKYTVIFKGKTYTVNTAEMIALSEDEIEAMNSVYIEEAAGEYYAVNPKTNERVRLKNVSGRGIFGGYIYIEQEEEAVESAVAEGMISIKLPLVNKNITSKSLQLLLLKYNNQTNELEDIIKDEICLEPSKSKVIDKQLTISKKSENSNYKICLWDSFEGMTPYIPVKTLSVKEADR